MLPNILITVCGGHTIKEIMNRNRFDRRLHTYEKCYYQRAFEQLKLETILFHYMFYFSYVKDGRIQLWLHENKVITKPVMTSPTITNLKTSDETRRGSAREYCVNVIQRAHV
jgi:hypothetical protein